MKTKRSGTKAVLRKLDQSADHSPLFHFMVEQHDSMVARANGGRMRWTDLCVTFVQLGLTTREGEPPDERNSRQTWYRVRKHVAQKRAEAARQAARAPAARTLLPSASPRERVPIEYPRPQPLPPKPAAPSGPVPPTDGTPGQSRADATIARMKRHFAERDGRKPTP